ncbi:MAG: hypothetical protein Q4G16_11700 [Cruoricaptor ignavus]|nr:hypothetical protein [Cruoricaptor ignavus]
MKHLVLLFTFCSVVYAQAQNKSVYDKIPTKEVVIGGHWSIRIPVEYELIADDVKNINGKKLPVKAYTVKDQMGRKVYILLLGVLSIEKDFEKEIESGEFVPDNKVNKQFASAIYKDKEHKLINGIHSYATWVSIATTLGAQQYRFQYSFFRKNKMLDLSHSVLDLNTSTRELGFKLNEFIINSVKYKD